MIEREKERENRETYSDNLEEGERERREIQGARDESQMTETN